MGKILRVVFILLVGQSAFSANWDQDLHWFNFVLQFSGMAAGEVDAYLNPTRGHTEFRLKKRDAPWAGNYFPMQDGGIANRWRIKEVPTEMYNRDSATQLNSKERRNLSPIEKFDILMGDYEFRGTQHELNNRGPKRTLPPQEWEGFCNGIRCAGLMMPEPRYSVAVQNTDGINVVFHPADLKALAGASYFFVEKYAQIGSPSKVGVAESQPNPAIFDLALRYHLGKNKKGFVIDSHLGAEIWNETIVGYKRILGNRYTLSAEEQGEHPGAFEKILVQLTLETLGEIEIRDSNQFTRKKVADGSLLTPLETAYTLYLDSNGRAIDGVWHNEGKERGVDFAWFVGGAGVDHIYTSQGGNPFLDFKVIQDLMEESAHPRCSKIFL